MLNIISISGTHCNGKSSIFKEISEELKGDSRFQFIGGPTRKLKEDGVPINKEESDNYDETQLRCLSYDLETIRKASQFKGYTITERSILDTYVYTKYLFDQGKVSNYVFELVKQAYLLNCKEFTAFFIPTHFDLKYEKDGVRDGDIQFREDIYKYFYDEYHTTQFHWISGTMYVRVGHLYDVIKHYFKLKLKTLRSSKYYEEKYPKSNLIPQEIYKFSHKNGGLIKVK